MSKKVSVLAACEARSHLRAHVRAGLTALNTADIELIHLPERQRVGDSLALDEATRAEQPSAHRWDYVVSIPATGELVGIEPHSARDAEISVVIQKKKNAAEYLSAHFVVGHRVARWIWVTRGRVGFSKMERARRLLDQNGIWFAGRIIRSLG